MEHLNEPPITQWAIMKSKLKRKYVPSYYEDNIAHEMMNLKQSTSSVTEYMENFEETLLRCDLYCDSVENPLLVLHRFVNGLRLDIQKELKLHSETIKEAYHKSLEIESCYQFPTSHSPKDSTGKSISKAIVSTNSHSVVASNGSRANSSSIKCFQCHDKGHIASQCPHRALALEQTCEEEHESEHNSSDYEEEFVGPIDYSGDENELDIDDEYVNIVHCVLSMVVDDDWKRNNIFHTFVKSGDRSCKLIIDGGS
ncbi:hypothetical protein GH714_033198 [Hevea brasiliensis]|uniref:CCHC-type domain-containing protein n=1 Tax=Hevea brasiliensis TaxID=3981 RepID=A0A6A6NE40_HEVBR|nr:hypothetical protein GH714_033198 [Hevea brasiliensis]